MTPLSLLALVPDGAVEHVPALLAGLMVVADGFAPPLAEANCGLRWAEPCLALTSTLLHVVQDQNPQEPVSVQLQNLRL